MRSFYSLLAGIPMLATILVFSNPASAQEETSENVLEEVIVSARKRDVSSTSPSSRVLLPRNFA